MISKRAVNNPSASVRRKWEPVINNLIEINNDNLMKHFCDYSEWLSKDGFSAGVVDKIKESVFRLKTSEQLRIEIVCEVFNKLTGRVEYKLSNGEYVDVSNYDSCELTLDLLVEIFGIDYVKYSDLGEYRDNAINKIINEGNK